MKGTHMVKSKKSTKSLHPITHVLTSVTLQPYVCKVMKAVKIVLVTVRLCCSAIVKNPRYSLWSICLSIYLIIFLLFVSGALTVFGGTASATREVFNGTAWTSLPLQYAREYNAMVVLPCLWNTLQWLYLDLQWLWITWI